MRRAWPIVSLLAVAAALAVAVLAATGAFSGARKASRQVGRAPACLPRSTEHSAKLAGLPVYVSPAPGSGTANPYTQIGFLGLPAAKIDVVSVAGTRSGAHQGVLRPYSQGDGASFIPLRPFQVGERVTVRAIVDASGAGANPSAGANPGGGAALGASASTGAGGPAAVKPVKFAFDVDTPYSTARVPPFPNPQASPADYQSFATLPGVQAPRLTVTVPDRDPGAGDVFLTNGPAPGRYGPLIYTPQGRLVWFEQLPAGRSAENLSVQSYEGAPHLTFWRGKVLSLGFGQGEDVVLDSHYRTAARVVGGNGLQADLHDFQIAPHGVSYTTAFNPIRCDLRSAGGARDGVLLDTAVQEIDMRSGLVRWEWHSLDHVGVREAENGASPKGGPWDWFHLNSIDVQPNGDLLISARSTWATYELQGGTGKVLWRLGGSRSSFKMGPGTRTAWQHDARLLPDGEVTLFDDGSNPPVHHRSRAIRLALDFSTHEAQLRSSFVHPNALLAVSQGNMQTLPNGNTVVGYGSIPQVSEFSPGGELLFDAHLPLEMDSYRAFRFPWSGQPESPPTVTASLNNTGEETLVRASWNGATEVSAWRILAGERPGALQPQTTVPASDFESAGILPSKRSYVQVQALDSSGKVLGSSPVSKVQSYTSAFPTPGARE